MKPLTCLKRLFHCSSAVDIVYLPRSFSPPIPRMDFAMLVALWEPK